MKWSRRSERSESLCVCVWIKTNKTGSILDELCGDLPAMVVSSALASTMLQRQSTTTTIFNNLLLISKRWKRTETRPILCVYRRRRRRQGEDDKNELSSSKTRLQNSSCLDCQKSSFQVTRTRTGPKEALLFKMNNKFRRNNTKKQGSHIKNLFDAASAECKRASKQDRTMSFMASSMACPRNDNKIDQSYGPLTLTIGIQGARLYMNTLLLLVFLEGKWTKFKMFEWERACCSMLNGKGGS